jgi:hypothetical protein
MLKASSNDTPQASPSRATSFVALTSVVVALVGIVGQVVNHLSVGFAMLGAFGLAVLAVVVLIHERG